MIPILGGVQALSPRQVDLLWSMTDNVPRSKKVAIESASFSEGRREGPIWCKKDTSAASFFLEMAISAMIAPTLMHGLEQSRQV